MNYKSLKLEFYNNQIEQWPKEGQHILAQYDHESIIVYQAYRPAIGHFAAKHGYFGGEFRLNRMSWIKPNFLWMMYRSGWGTKAGQEVILAIRLKRNFFDEVLAAAVPSSYKPDGDSTKQQWQKKVQNSDVRLQWDPDHDPSGRKMPRRAIQLGLRGEFLATYAKAAVLEIIDVSEFVSEQRNNVTLQGYSNLVTPLETVYSPNNPELINNIV